MNTTHPALGVVIVTHGQLATELLNAAEMIVGDLPAFEAVSIGWHDDVTVARTLIEQAVARVNVGAGVLILTDMFGGTPSNLSVPLLQSGRVEVVTGVNLPMLIKLARTPPVTNLLTLCQDLCADGRASIRVASDLLRVSPPVAGRQIGK